MCLASEAGKIGTVQSHPEDSSSKASLQQNTIKIDMEQTASVCFSSTSTDAIPQQLSNQNAHVKNRIKKKDMTQLHNKDEMPCSANMIRECNLAESNTDSVFTTIESVAKGVWKCKEEKPRKKLQRSTSAGNSAVPKKKSKPKVSEKEKEADDNSGQGVQYSSSDVEMKKEMSIICPKTEIEEDPQIDSSDLQGSMAKPCQSPCRSSPAKVKEEDQGKETRESTIENCGSRKSERRCKGALYKTLVSEGMLTSLRANIDRGNFF